MITFGSEANALKGKGEGGKTDIKGVTDTGKEFGRCGTLVKSKVGIQTRIDQNKKGDCK
jgi:hypothetical protein